MDVGDELGQDDLPPNIHLIEYAPYEWLFPRMAAIVHHGGSGTTAFALRAGIPSIVVPFVFDQFYWGKRVLDLGIGPEPIPHKKLSAANHAATLDLVFNDTHTQECATALGDKIRLDDGVRTAVDVIEDVIRADH